MGTRTQSTFGAWLREELDRQGMGARTLARRIDPGHPERVRRTINRYLSGDTTRPSAPMRRAIADALGCRVADLPRDDDEEPV